MMYWHVSAKPFYLENLSNYCMRIRKSVRLCLGKSPKFWVRLHYPHPPYFMSCGGKKSAGCMHLSTVSASPNLALTRHVTKARPYKSYLEFAEDKKSFLPAHSSMALHVLCVWGGEEWRVWGNCRSTCAQTRQSLPWLQKLAQNFYYIAE